MQSIHTLLTTSKGKLDAVYPALLAIINNIAPHVEGLGRVPSLKLLQLFGSMSSPKFLLANESNHVLLQSLLEALNAVVEHRYESRCTSRIRVVARHSQPHRQSHADTRHPAL
ncbi:MAG: hypothetical protein INR71_07270 [Terriglobus roseus]|nr:hypothetical protein [Terriglobus roseus]